jgi:hypothetical protein
MLDHAAKRFIDAQAVPSPALESFLPTPEFPEIVTAQRLLAELSRSFRRRRPWYPDGRERLTDK